MTPSREFLSWPFFEATHRALHARLQEWLAGSQAIAHELRHDASRAEVDAHCRAWVAALAQGGWLRHAIGGVAHGGAADVIDTRAICLLREALAAKDGLADFAFAMQGLGSGAITLAGSPALQSHYLPRVVDGRAIAAFALSEPDAGSDVAAMRMTARRDGANWILEGEKTWISNGGIADFYVVFARAVTSDVAPGRASQVAADAISTTPSAPPPRGTRDIAAFVVDASSPGLEIAERLDVMAPHPLARLRFQDCRVPATHLLAPAGEGFKLAMRTLDIFRTSVAAAALGYARRALVEGLARAKTRPMFGQRLADLPLAQARLADMAVDVDSAALLTYRAAWARDQGRTVTREAAMAKLAATEGAQRVVDAAVQLWGGAGVRAGNAVERLYRDIRALRIYEGASEVQQLIIARELLKEDAP
ncbi:MAG TPA: acyl-CoA dehydrogenase family protein [Burkholderiaceae bacterium]|nr:acyl-CoA dehydrogenase family protein [Burkholderiaceae bacterium]